VLDFFILAAVYQGCIKNEKVEHISCYTLNCTFFPLTISSYAKKNYVSDIPASYIYMRPPAQILNVLCVAESIVTHNLLYGCCVGRRHWDGRRHSRGHGVSLLNPL
jgi:hypothetical protein